MTDVIEFGEDFPVCHADEYYALDRITAYGPLILASTSQVWRVIQTQLPRIELLEDSDGSEQAVATCGHHIIVGTSKCYPNMLALCENVGSAT